MPITVSEVTVSSCSSKLSGNLCLLFAKCLGDGDVEESYYQARENIFGDVN